MQEMFSYFIVSYSRYFYWTICIKNMSECVASCQPVLARVVFGTFFAYTENKIIKNTVKTL